MPSARRSSSCPTESTGVVIGTTNSSERVTTFTRSKLETEAAPPRRDAVLWLAATVILVAPVRVAGPGFGLDSGWAAGLNLGRQAGMSFGRQLIFTLGPWGFLDVPLALTRPGFLLGLGFSVASVVAVWLLTMAVLRTKLRPQVALVAVSLLTIIVSSISSPSFLLAAAAALACIGHLRQIPTLTRAWCPVAVAGFAALLLQIKFSEGVAVTAFAFTASLASPRARLLRTTCSGFTWVVTSLVLWVVAGQSMTDIGPWLRTSTDLAVGFTAAPSSSYRPCCCARCWKRGPGGAQGFC